MRQYISHFIFEKIDRFKQQVLMINENINIAVALHKNITVITMIDTEYLSCKSLVYTK